MLSNLNYRNQVKIMYVIYFSSDIKIVKFEGFISMIFLQWSKVERFTRIVIDRSIIICLVERLKYFAQYTHSILSFLQLITSGIDKIGNVDLCSGWQHMRKTLIAFSTAARHKNHVAEFSPRADVISNPGGRALPNEAIKKFWYKLFEDSVKTEQIRKSHYKAGKQQALDGKLM